MRRIALLATVMLAASAAGAAAIAGADDTHTYKVEMDNAFGIVEGSLVRVAGVDTGTVTDLDVNDEKRALLTIETSGPVGELGVDTTCSSEPQSLIAEYFIDCQPAGEPLPEGGTIPVEQVTQTVQPDLVQNTMREPFKRRFQLLLNEFGTALAGNPDNLNAAVRRGAPALRELEEVLDILGDQARIIRDLNANSDRVIGRLAERREDVARFVREARDTAAASASRRADLSRDFEILDDFLAELRPTLADLETLAAEQTPLLTDLRAAAPGLNTLALNLPAFNDASTDSLTTLGDAAVVGRRALENGEDEIQLLRAAGKNAPRTTELLKDFVRDLDDPGRAVEVDARASEHTGREAPTGYTGLEGLLNYVYYQSGAINQFDRIGHTLHINLFNVDTGPCGHVNTGRDPETGEKGVPDQEGEEHGATKLEDVHHCVNWLGESQPGVNEINDVELPRYDASVCPRGTEPEKAREELCDPKIETEPASRSADSSEGGSSSESGGAGTAPGAVAPALPGLPSVSPGKPDEVAKGLEDLLGVPDAADLDGLDKALGAKKKKGGKDKSGGDGAETAEELMDFLFGD